MKPAAEVQAQAEAWFRQQIERARARQGARWDEHKAWVADYLREQVRQRLRQRGWRRNA